MRRNFNWDQKYLHWGITAFCVIAGCTLFYQAVAHLQVFGTAIRNAVAILSPFIWGLVFVYFLAPLMNVLERSAFLPLLSRTKASEKSGKTGPRRQKTIKSLARALAIFVSELVLLLILAVLVWLIIPQLYTSIENIVVNSGLYFDTATNWIEKALADYPTIDEYVVNAADKLSNWFTSWFTNDFLKQFGSVVSSLTTGVYHVATAVYNLVIGVIVSVYILADKERYLAAAKRILYSVFSVEASQRIISAVVFTDRTFRGFFTGKLLDSAIIGVICYIGCAIMRMPYTLLLSVLIGVTNIIPFFGPVIGLVPSALLVLFVSPIKCLLFVIFVLVLQQVDGNLIGPKILGNSVGISGFWVMFSIIVGAGICGFWGMLLGVPVFVVIYTGINRLIDRKLKKSSLPSETEEYIDLVNIDPATLKLTYRKKTAAGSNTEKENKSET